MSPYLIAHVVRGQPAFDIAEQCPCAICGADPTLVDFAVPTQEDCDYCGGDGFIWHIPTSGHRAHPFWSKNLNEWFNTSVVLLTEPPNWPDHYPPQVTKAQPADSHGLLASLGLLKPTEPLKRRI